MKHLCSLTIAITIVLPAHFAHADRALPKEAVLVVGQLSVSGSYLENTESPSPGPGNTVQWWIQGAQMWRIKTFHQDGDLHLHVVPLQDPDPVRFAEEHIREHYAPVLRSISIVRLPDVSDAASIKQALRSAGLGAGVVVSPYGFGFWNPDGGEYRARSSPAR